MIQYDRRFIPESKHKKSKPNRNEIKIILIMIFKVLIPIKWKMFKESVRNRFKRKIIYIK